MNYKSKKFLINGLVLILLLPMMLAAQQKARWHAKDQGITSPEHKKFVKQIVWSKSEIAWRDMANSILETRFKLTDPIYGRIFCESSIRNTPVYSTANDKPIENTKNSFEMKLYIDGKDAGGSFGVFYETYYNDELGMWTTWQFSPHLLNPESNDEQLIGTAWEKAVRGLGAGEHSIRFELWGVLGTYRTSEPMSKGSFTLVVSKGEKIATGTEFPQDSYSGNDKAKLHKQLKNALVQKGMASASEIRKVAISGDWAYNRYTDSKKEYRKISAAVLFSDKDNDGVCRFVTYNFISDKSGNSWTAPRFHSFCNGCPEGDVNCSK